jgi:hypothetical protein
MRTLIFLFLAFSVGMAQANDAKSSHGEAEARKVYFTKSDAVTTKGDSAWSRADLIRGKK